MTDDIRATPSVPLTSLSAGSLHTCGLAEDGTALCWGSDQYGQSSPPEGAFLQVSAGVDHSCGVRESGDLVCWGDDSTDEPPVGPFEAVAAGSLATCGARRGGGVECWGLDAPDVSEDPSFVEISLGLTACAVTRDGLVRCWGGDSSVVDGPVRVGGWPELSRVATHVSVWGVACVLWSDGVAQCWGLNYVGLDAPQEEGPTLAAQQSDYAPASDCLDLANKLDTCGAGSPLTTRCPVTTEQECAARCLMSADCEEIQATYHGTGDNALSGCLAECWSR